MTKNNDTPETSALPAVDTNSVYYIHPSDYPRQMHVNDPLNDSNYGDWSEEMKNFLFAKNKFGFIDGSITTPKEGSDLMLWKRCDAMIKGWLRTAMEKDIRNSVKYAETAEEIWNDLEERFGKESAPRAYELKHALSLVRQEKASISAYYTRLRGLWDEIQSVSPMPKCTCGLCKCEIGKKLIERKEKEQLYEFLMGLDDNYGTVKTQILTTKPTPSLGTAYHMVAEDEQQRIISTGRRTALEGAAFQTQQRSAPQTRQIQNFQEQQTHNHHVQPSQQRSNTEISAYKAQGRGGEARRTGPDDEIRCEHCNKSGHTIDGCFKIIGFPDWWTDRKRRDGGRGGDRKNNPRAAHVNIDSSPIPGLNKEQYSRLIKQFSEGENSNTPSINMAGLTFEDHDWRG